MPTRGNSLLNNQLSSVTRKGLTRSRQPSHHRRFKATVQGWLLQYRTRRPTLLATPKVSVRYVPTVGTWGVGVKHLWYTKRRRAQNPNDFETWIVGGGVTDIERFR